EGYGGRTSGHARLAKDQRQGLIDELQLNAVDIDLKQLPMKELTSLDLNGRLTLKADLSRMSPLDQASGQVTATIKGGVVNGGQVRGFTMPKLNLGEIDAQATLDKGLAKVDKTAARGGDLDASADGTLRLKPLLSLSQADLHVSFRPSDAWLSANPVFKVLLSAVNNARQPYGSYVFTLNGPLS